MKKVKQSMCERAAGVNPLTKRQRELAELYKSEAVCSIHTRIVATMSDGDKGIFQEHPEPFNATAESIVLALQFHPELLSKVIHNMRLAVKEDCR